MISFFLDLLIGIIDISGLFLEPARRLDKGVSMEKHDEELVGRWIDQDPELKNYMDKHLEYERQLEEFNRRPYLSNDDNITRKKIQKLKLAGRDKIEQILIKYRAKESQS